MAESIVVYYTWAGHTKAMAEAIAKITGAEILEINPKEAYPSSYGATVTQAKKEISDGYLPAIEEEDFNLGKYDTVYIGSPIWWGTVAPPIAAFFMERDMTGKVVMPFTTHGGGGKGHSDKTIAELCAGADVRAMYTCYEGGNQNDIENWIRSTL